MPPYKAEISAGSLLPPESKRAASLWLPYPDESSWISVIEVENILQKDYRPPPGVMPCFFEIGY
jgi:hypothetical protein